MRRGTHSSSGSGFQHADEFDAAAAGCVARYVGRSGRPGCAIDIGHADMSAVWCLGDSWRSILR
jgi:hypothetical protein